MSAAGFPGAVFLLGSTGDSADTLFWVPLVSLVLLLPWLPLLTQVPQVPLFQGAALAIGDDVTVGVMIATGFSGAALSQGASAVSGVTL